MAIDVGPDKRQRMATLCPVAIIVHKRIAQSIFV
jgi:hypothetical protein